MDLADRLRVLRAAHSFTQLELARRAGLEAVTITRIERRHRTPQPATLQVLAEALEVPREALEDDVACFRAMAKILEVKLPELLPRQQPPGESAMGYSDGLRDGLFPSDPVASQLLAELRDVRARLEALERERRARPTTPSPPAPKRPAS